MKSFESDYTAESITESIDKYLESGMTYDEICRAIDDEWPHQLAVMLREFLLKTTCPHCMNIVSFCKADRQDGPGEVYVPVCECEAEEFVPDTIDDDEEEGEWADELTDEEQGFGEVAP